jgi:hypothetical protein
MADMRVNRIRLFLWHPENLSSMSMKIKLLEWREEKLWRSATSRLRDG